MKMVGTIAVWLLIVLAVTAWFIAGFFIPLQQAIVGGI